MKPKFLRILEHLHDGHEVKINSHTFVMGEDKHGVPQVAIKAKKKKLGSDEDWEDYLHDPAVDLNLFLQICESVSEEDMLDISLNRTLNSCKS